jgi:hypothetical protein
VSWTPRELIESLSKWQPDEPIDVAIQFRVPPSGNTRVLLVQGTNAINLSGDDE